MLGNQEAQGRVKRETDYEGSIPVEGVKNKKENFKLKREPIGQFKE